MTEYTIIDEPQPGSLSKIVVNPFWPFLATLLGGVWLGWSWFVLNSFALGSATRTREVVATLIGLLGTATLAALSLSLYSTGRIAEDAFGYAVTVVIVWKLAVTYMLHLMQHRSFEVYEYFGGPTRNGMLVLLAGFLLRSRVTELVARDLLILILL